MSEQDPNYTTSSTIPGLLVEAENTNDPLRLYLLHRRMLLIIELREVERQLGVQQSIPARRR